MYRILLYASFGLHLCALTQESSSNCLTRWWHASTLNQLTLRRTERDSFIASLKEKSEVELFTLEHEYSYLLANHEPQKEAQARCLRFHALLGGATAVGTYCASYCSHPSAVIQLLHNPLVGAVFCTASSCCYETCHRIEKYAEPNGYCQQRSYLAAIKKALMEKSGTQNQRAMR